jgi:hypothetical protein
MEFERLITMDGNNSLKRVLTKTVDERAYTRSPFFLSHEFVNAFGAQSSDPASKSMLEPTDGLDAPTPCAENWTAASADSKKRMWSIFDESGVFGTFCRHGMTLWIADMIRSGELYVFPL